MASAIRHKTVRPDTTVLLQSVLTGNSEPVRVVSKTANDVALLFGNGCTLAYSAVSGDSVVYRADNGHEFKLFPVPASTEVQPMPEPTPVPVAVAVLPVESDHAIPHQDIQPDTIMLLELRGEHITATQEVYIVTKAAQGLKVMHANGEHRYLYTNVPDLGIYQDGNCKATGMTFRLLPTEETKQAERVA